MLIDYTHPTATADIISVELSYDKNLSIKFSITTPELDGMAISSHSYENLISREKLNDVDLSKVSFTLIKTIKGNEGKTSQSDYTVIPNENPSVYEGAYVLTKNLFNIDESNLVYTAKAIKKSICPIAGINLIEGKDYKVSYKNNTNVGTATITITGLNDYYGTVTKTFKIVPKKLASSQFSLSTTKYGYTGTTKKPAVKSKLKLNKDYTVTYSSNLYVGTAKVTIKGKGNYTGTITKYFSIVKPTAPGAEKVTKLVAGKKTVTVTYAKKTGVKYKVLICSNRSFKGARKALTTKTSVKFTKLTSGKKYYVKVCAYKTYKTSKTKAGYVYGKYSALKAIRAK